jgi:DNA-binding MarR family transcriptional regulator
MTTLDRIDPDTTILDSTAEHIGQDLARLLRLVARHRHRTDAGADVLGVLLERGPARVGEIAAALCSDPSTVSRKVAALVDAGLVERRVDPGDGRAHLLAVTAAAEQHRADACRRRNDMVASVLTGWPDDNRRRLAELLGRFVDGMQEQDGRLGARSGGEN